MASGDKLVASLHRPSAMASGDKLVASLIRIFNQLVRKRVQINPPHQNTKPVATL
jgi:hypothetical protein